MAIFKYKAMNQKGERIEGTYTAASRDEVMNMISANNYYPLGIEEVIESTKIELSLFERVKVRDISIFCRQLYTMLNAGVSVNNALNILSNQITNKKLKNVVINLEERVKKGETLSEAMNEHSNVFPALLISMVEAGEMSGNLDGVFDRMAVHFEKETKINNKVKSAMIYPTILAIVAVVVVIILLAFVMPTFIKMFADSGVELPLVTKILLGASNALRNYGLVFFIIFIAISVFLFRYKQTEKGKIFISKTKLSVPILKTLNKKIITSRFTRTLSTLLSSGIGIVQAIEVVSSVVGNKIAQQVLYEVREDLVKGEGLSNSIKKSDLFPPMLSSMIMIGEESGSLDDILNKTADFYDEELEVAVQTATALLEPLLIVVMGLVMGLIVIAIMLPMFSMYNMI